MAQLTSPTAYIQATNTGNRFRTWRTIQEVEESGYKGPIWVRPRKPGVRTWHFPDIPADMLRYLSHDIISNAYFTEVPPPGTLRVIQGQVTESTGIFVAHLDRSQRPLRQVLQEGGYTKTHSRLVLKSVLDPEDYEMLLETLDQFPGCVVEFTMWERPVGVMGRRLCFWEVRNY